MTQDKSRLTIALADKHFSSSSTPVEPSALWDTCKVCRLVAPESGKKQDDNVINETDQMNEQLRL